MAQIQSSIFAKAYNSFSGVDIRAVFGNRIIGELQAISYGITREKAPIYTMGSADPRSYSRGKRGIAGTCVFIVFDRHALISELGRLSPFVGPSGLPGLVFQADVDEVRPGPGDTPVGNIAPVEEAETQLDTTDLNPLSDQQLASAWYVDQIPPFDITLAAANEYGAAAVMRIFGVELLNEAYGVSIDDIVSEQQFSYAARTVIGWTPVESPNRDRIAAQSASGS